jgi:shikimate dehydrogenase
VTDRYAVIGNPVAHSKSPLIHAAFAQGSRQDMTYERILAPRDGFAAAVAEFAAAGGQGLNVTVPFKLDAIELAATASPRAHAAGACNTLKRAGNHWHADNTDGAGLVRDLTLNHRVSLAGRDILLLGAGGAARGIIVPLLGEGARSLTVANRTASRADELAERFAGEGPVSAMSVQALAGRDFDLVINATSAGLKDDVALPWPTGLFRRHAFAYDLIYADAPTLFLRWAREQGVMHTADGLGMLIEQAAESFALWRGITPDTAPIFKLLRPHAPSP